MDVNLADTVVIKKENLFLVCLRDSSLPARGPHPLGLWYRDCRFLSAHELRLNGVPARLLQASDAPGTRSLHELTNTELALAGGAVLPGQLLRVRVERTLTSASELEERILVRSHHHAQVELNLELTLAADFEPMLALRGIVPRVARPPVERELDGRILRLSTIGRDCVTRAATIAFDRAPDASTGTSLTFTLALAPGAHQELMLSFQVSEDGQGAPPRRRTPPASTRVTTDDELFDRVLRRSLRDVELLRSELDGRSYYAAGVPWYATLFGRDSLIAATQMLSVAPTVGEHTLRLLGGLQGRQLDDERDEEPGKVLHELRVGEPATLGETAFARYYGSADATPLWLCLLCDHADWSGSLDLFRELRGQVDAALEWMERHADLDGDALLEYRRRAPSGLVSQGWKDSWDGVPDEHGRPLEPPVALVEVQGYAIRARRRVARLLALNGEAGEAERLDALADLQARALDSLWLAQPGGYAIGLDAGKRPGSALTSNQGHLLWAGALGRARAGQIRDLLMSEAMFSGWGIRTLADGHPAFNPLGYHTGSVWPHDSAMIACGLRRYGFDEDFMRVFEALLEAASRFDDHRLPELFAGYARTGWESPVPYPVACRPQAWAAGAIPYLLTWALGLCPEGLAGRLRIVRPSLPGWLDRVQLEGLRVADSTVSLHFERSDGRVTLVDAQVEGDIEVVVEMAEERPRLPDI